MSISLEQLASTLGVLGALLASVGGVASAMLADRRLRRAEQASKMAVEHVRRLAAARIDDAYRLEGETGADARSLLKSLLHAHEMRILQSTEQGVALDIAQICSATELPPSQVRVSVKSLLKMGLLESEGEDRDQNALRYRKQVTDDLIGGGR